MKIYVDSLGKIYVNLHQPLYFKISSSPKKSSKKYLLHSHSTSSIVNPLYFRHEGANIVYTPWAVDTLTRKLIYPHIDVKFLVYADGTSPKSKLIFSRPGVIYRDTTFFTSGIRISIEAKDNIVGVDSIFYSINNEPFELYKDELFFVKEGFYNLNYYSIDKVGNVEKIRNFSFSIDNSAPILNFKIVGAKKGDVLSPKAKIKLAAQDNLTQVKKIVYILDDTEPLIYRYPIVLNNLYEGWHTIKFFTIDILGNKSDTINYKFFLDKTPPLIIEEIKGSSYFVGDKQFLSANSKLKLLAIDNYSGVKHLFYSFDRKNWHEYTSPIPFPKSQRQFNLYYYAVDSVGNKSAISESVAQRSGLFTTFIDLTPPEITYNFDKFFRYGDTIFISPETKITIYGKDKESGLKVIYYQIDNDTMLTYTKSFSLKEEGMHNIAISAYDNVDNIAIKEFEVKVDKTAPKINYVFSVPPYQQGDKLIYPKRVKLFITARDNMVGVRTLMLSVNNGPYKIFTNVLRDIPLGKNIVKVIAIDYLGNKSEKIISFIVK